MSTIIDIITVTKDDLPRIAATIESTRRLRYGDGLRQIVIDSSGPRHRERVRQLVNGETNVLYVWQEPSGIARAFNLGLSLSNAVWVWFLNGGDEVHEGVDREKLLYLVKESAADAMVFQIELMQSRTRYRHPPMWSKWPPVSAWIPHPATLVRRRLFQQYGHFSEQFDIAMDFEFWIRCFSQNVIVDTISIPLATFDTTGMSYTQTNKVSGEGLAAMKLHACKLVRLWLNNGRLILATWWRFSLRSRKG